MEVRLRPPEPPQVARCTLRNSSPSRTAWKKSGSWSSYTWTVIDAAGSHHEANVSGLPLLRSITPSSGDDPQQPGYRMRPESRSPTISLGPAPAGSFFSARPVTEPGGVGIDRT